MGAERAVRWSTGKGCAQAVLLTYPSGATRSVVVPCYRWACDVCAARRADDIATHLKAASEGSDLFAGEVGAEWWGAARAMAMRRGAAYVSVKRFNDDALLITDTALSGRSWALEPCGLGDVPDVILTRSVRRVDWCKRWRPVKDDRGRVVVSRIAVPPAWAAEVLERAGFDPAQGRIPGLSAEECAERIADALAAVQQSKGRARRGE